jgi:hypothetical protein
MGGVANQWNYTKGYNSVITSIFVSLFCYWQKKWHDIVGGFDQKMMFIDEKEIVLRLVLQQQSFHYELLESVLEQVLYRGCFFIGLSNSVSIVYRWMFLTFFIRESIHLTIFDGELEILNLIQAINKRIVISYLISSNYLTYF